MPYTRSSLSSSTMALASGPRQPHGAVTERLHHGHQHPVTGVGTTEPGQGGPGEDNLQIWCAVYMIGLNQTDASPWLDVAVGIGVDV
jgi:hypothetical protein